MNRLNPWAFGIIFLIVSFFILTTDSNVELLFSGKKKNTKAIITKTKISYGLKGRGYVQYLNFYFITGGELIYGYKKTKIKEPWQYIGNSINIEYSEKKPLVNKILEFNNEYGSSNMESFLNVKKDGYSQISFNNGVFFYENSNGVELKKIVGTFEKFKDSIFLYDFFGKKNKPRRPRG